MIITASDLQYIEEVAGHNCKAFVRPTESSVVAICTYNDNGICLGFYHNSAEEDKWAESFFDNDGNKVLIQANLKGSIVKIKGPGKDAYAAGKALENGHFNDTFSLFSGHYQLIWSKSVDDNVEILYQRLATH